MKNMKNIIKSSVILFLLFGFVSCGNLFSGREKDSSTSKTTLKIEVQDTSLARTIYPDSKDTSFITNFVVTCTRDGFDKKEQTASSSQELGSMVFEFADGEEGEWNITLQASYKVGTGSNAQTVSFSDTKSVSIQKNTTNKVSFVLKNTDFEYGGLNVTVNFADKTDAVTSVYLHLDKCDGTNFDTIDEIDITTFETTAEGKSFTYSRDISDTQTRLDSGYYHLEITFLSGTDSLNYMSYFVRIVNGLTTTATLDIAVNQIFDIEYEFYAAGTKLTVASGETFPEGVELDGASLLPTKYSTRGTELPALKLQDYGFDGWYDAPTGGNLITKLSGFPETGTSKKVYARFFKPEVIVSSDSTVNPDYTSINEAIVAIRQYAKERNSKNIDWKIKVRGTLTGKQIVNKTALDYNDAGSSDPHAASITIEGYTPPAEGSDPTDTIDAGLTTQTDEGVVIYITAGVPVIFKNIKITGGNDTNSASYPKGGGIYIGPGTNVTFGDGVLLTGNSAPEGSGIYAMDDFTIGGSARLDTGNDIYLGKDSNGDLISFTISSSLTKVNTSNKITITPSVYKNGSHLMYLSGSGITDAQKAAEYEKFEIPQQQGVTNYFWHVNSKGYLSKYNNSADGSDYVDLELPSGTLWSVKNYGQTDSVSGAKGDWNNLDYGNKIRHPNEPTWGEEWSIASTEEWNELITECYWESSSRLQTSGGNGYWEYYVYKAKDPADKGKVGPYSEQTTSYDPEVDLCIPIIRCEGDGAGKACYYWPQVFVDSTSGPTKDVTPIVSFYYSSAPTTNATWSDYTTNENVYFRLVINNKRTLCVTTSGNDDQTVSGRNTANALASIPGAIARISEAETNSTNHGTIDWEILVFGDVTVPTLDKDNIASIGAKSITAYKVDSSTNQKKALFRYRVTPAGNVEEDFVEVAGMTISSAVQDSSVFKDGRTLQINDFYMCDHEVTQKEWQRVMGDIPRVMKSDPVEEDPDYAYEIGDNYPVQCVSWYQAIVYCSLLSVMEHLDCAYSISGVDWEDFDLANIPTARSTAWDKVTVNMNANGYRLPTEVEWEYAARGGKRLETYKFPGSNDYTKVAWLQQNSDYKAHIVKEDKTSGIDSANSLGIYDLCGNVNEWCWDIYIATVSTNHPITGPSYNDVTTIQRAKRGGGWDSSGGGTDATLYRHTSSSSPYESKGNQRISGTSDHWYFGYGFRVVRTATVQ